MSTLIAVHALFATLALLSGAVALWARRVRDTRPAAHRAAGYVFVGTMWCAAGTAYFIRDSDLLNWRGFTLLHLLIPLTMIGMARGLWLVKHHRVAQHLRVMRMVYFGGCVIAGAFTLMPNRIIGQWLWSALGVLSSSMT